MPLEGRVYALRGRDASPQRSRSRIERAVLHPPEVLQARSFYVGKNDRVAEKKGARKGPPLQ